MAERYKVIEGSESGHCCFDATVVDTTRPRIGGDGKPMKKYRSRHFYYESVCECFAVTDAKRIAAALNQTD